MRRIILLTAFLALSVPLLWSQTVRATLTGSIVDPAGAAVSGAIVKVTSESQGVATTTKTNSSGTYTVPELDPGSYTVQVEATGFRPEIRKDVSLQVEQAARQDFKLQIGDVSVAVQVSGQSVALNTDDATVGQVIANNSIVELPLNGRNYLQLALLTTGVAPANGSRVQAAGGFSALGQHGFQMHVILDGVDNSSRASGGDLGYRAQVVTPSVDAIEEFKVVTENNSAEYGFRMGGTVIVSTKSGSNSFHGSAFEFLRNDKLDAVNYFSAGQPKSPYRRNEFGGVIGGPIIRDRTFFLVSYDGTRSRQSNPVISTVPLPSMFPSADAPFASFAGLNTIYQPSTTTTNSSGKSVRTPFPGNVIPLASIDPVALELAQLIPSPNLSGVVNNYYYAGASTDMPNEVDARLDQTFNQRYKASLRYSHNWESQLNAGNLPLPADGAAATTLGLKADSAVANVNAVVSSNIYNDLSLGYSDLSTVLGIPETQNLNAQYGITGLNNFGTFNQTGLAAIALTGYSSIGSKSSNPNRNSLRMAQVADNIFITRGNHSFVAGFSFLGEQVYRQTAKNARGGLTFDGSYTQNPTSSATRASSGNAIADFLLGYAQKTQQSNTAGETATAHNYSAYVQDNWRATKRLTVNLGIRWDLFGSPSYGVSASKVNAFTFMPGSQVYQVTTPKNGSDCGCSQDWNNFAPRVGFSFQANPGTVIRSGFALVYGEPDGIQDSTGRFFNQSPYYSAITVSGDKATAPAIFLKNGFPVLDYNTGKILTNVSVNEADRFIPAQYVMQWFADVQQQLSRSTVFTLSYLGSGTRHLIVSLNEDQPEPGPGTIVSREPHPAFSAISYSAPVGNAEYHALTAKIERRFSNGFSLLSSYTWSHAIDDAGENLNSASGQDIQDNYDLAAERSNSVFDLRNYFVTNAIYDLPFGYDRPFLNRRGWLDEVIGGWQISGIVSLYSGTPFTPQLSIDVANVGTVNRPNRIRSGELSKGQRSISHWFDPSEFTIPTQYTFGNSGRNILSGPGTRNVDAKLGKDFRITEGRHLDFRAEFFNALNTPNFGVPSAEVDLATAGQITTAKPGREIQLGLKFVY